VSYEQLRSDLMAREEALIREFNDLGDGQEEKGQQLLEEINMIQFVLCNAREKKL